MRKKISHLKHANGLNPYAKSENRNNQDEIDFVVDVCKLLNTHTILNSRCGIQAQTKENNLRARYMMEWLKETLIDEELSVEDAKEARAKKVEALIKKSCKNDDFGFHQHIPLYLFLSFEDMNGVMLIHCLGITLEAGQLFLPSGIRSLNDTAEDIIARVLYIVQDSYETSYRKFSSEYKGILSKEIVVDTHSFAIAFIKEFQEADLLGFITNPDNLIWSGFQEYFLTFCQLHNIDSHDAEPEYTHRAFIALLGLIHMLFREVIEDYSKEVIIKCLYDKKCMSEADYD